MSAEEARRTVFERSHPEALAEIDRLRAEVAKTRLDLLAAQVERDQYKQWLKDREPPPNPQETEG